MDNILLVHVTTVAVAIVANLAIWSEYPKPDRGPDVNILHLGKTGSGRSALGNHILGREEFESYVSPISVTKQSRMKRTEIGSRKLYVVDTPGIYVDPNKMEAERIFKDLISRLSLCPKGYHAFVVVMKSVNRMSKEELDTLRYLEIIFRERLFKYVIFVFTHKDLFEASLKPHQNITDEFTSYIDNQPAEMKKMLEKAGHRVLFVNSLEDNLYRKRIFHIDLILLVDEIGKTQYGRIYTRREFDETQEHLKGVITRRVEEEERERVDRENSIQAEAFAKCPCREKQEEKFHGLGINMNLNIPGIGYIMKAANYILGYAGNFIETIGSKLPGLI